MNLIRNRPEDLAEISRWTSTWSPQPTVMEFLSQTVSAPKALAVMRLFWPEFVEIRGCVLLSSRYSASEFQQWWETLDGDHVRIEKVMNHVHLWDVFGPTLEGDGAIPSEEVALEELGQLMRRTFTAALLEEFPGRQFEVVYSADPEEYGPTVAFWTVAIAS
jgi:hypothetical protein